MAAGEKFHGSNLKLAGYLKLLDNPIYLGLTDNAYITTSISSSSLDITNLSGDIDINSTNINLNATLISSPGLFKYQADYSGIYDDRTLVDKEYVDNQILLVGVSYWDLNTAGELVLNLGVPGPVMPHTTSIVDLGSSSYKWQDLFLSGSIDKVTVNNAYTLPNTDGTNGQILKTNGSGVVTWQTDAGGSSNLSDLNDVSFITGTPIEGDILVYNGTDWEARELPVTFNVSGAVNSNRVTNQYISSDGIGMFLSPFILPEDATLKYMSASCAVTGTWTAEVHVNGTLFTGATVTVTSAKKAYIKFTSILSFNAGDEIQLYLNGTNIDKPRISAVFVSVP
jgi:hypothetical protein